MVYISSDKSVVTIDYKGVITLVNNGTASITVISTDGSNVSKTYDIVVDFKATSVILDKTNLTFSNKETQNISATVGPEYAKNKNVAWTSSDEQIATVNENGIVTPVGNGTCEVICKTTDGSEIEVKCSVTVNIPYKRGDYDKNNIVDVTDAYLLLTAILKNIELADDLKGIIDMNEDGRVMEKDVVNKYGDTVE